MSSILQIVPRQPPPEEALFQVAQRLVEAFRERSVESRIVAASPDRARYEQELRSASGDEVVLLHYVGYGYARRGAPLRLARDLARWKQAVRHRILLVHFHEVAAFGPPWRSSFWLRPFQLAAARRLARAADRSMTSLDRFAALLRRRGVAAPIEVLPIFSTIGETEGAAPLRERSPRLVLFGSPAARARIWSEARAELEVTVTSLDVRSIVETGRDPVGPDELAGRRVARTGELGDEEIRRLLTESSAAFFDYPVEYLSKSSAFAAACAHAVLPVCRPRREHSGRADGEGERWVTAAALRALDSESRQRVASAARRWYGEHSTRRHAEFWGGAFAK